MPHDFIRFPELTNNQMTMYYWDSPHRQITEDFTARVTKVIDGDTIRVSWVERGFEFPIRFAGIAAPELNEQGGRMSQRWLQDQIFGKDVEIIVDRHNRVEKWGRLLGEVLHQGINLNEASINAGYSIPFIEDGDTTDI